MDNRYLPAVEALVIITVWNHKGKKYIIVNEQSDTRKPDVATRTGIFFFSRKGARTGSRAKKSSVTRNPMAPVIPRQRDMMTVLSDHFDRPSEGEGRSLKRTYR